MGVHERLTIALAQAILRVRGVNIEEEITKMEQEVRAAAAAWEEAKETEEQVAT